MAVSKIVQPSGSSSGLDSSQVFNSTGNFSVPNTINYVHVRARGGDGGHSGPPADANANGIILYGNNGGTTNVGSIGAPGGSAGRSQRVNNYGGWASPNSGVVVESMLSVTPGSNISVAIGAGAGAHAVISWSGS